MTAIIVHNHVFHGNVVVSVLLMSMFYTCNSAGRGCMLCSFKGYDVCLLFT